MGYTEVVTREIGCRNPKATFFNGAGGHWKLSTIGLDVKDTEIIARSRLFSNCGNAASEKNLVISPQGLFYKI